MVARPSCTPVSGCELVVCHWADELVREWNVRASANIAMFSRREIAPESKSSDATASFRFASSFLFVYLFVCLLAHLSRFKAYRWKSIPRKNYTCRSSSLGTF